MVEEGRHRKAMVWIAAGLNLANTAIQLDTPEAEQPQFQAYMQQLLFDMGLGAPDDVEARFQRAKALADRPIRCCWMEYYLASAPATAGHRRHPSDVHLRTPCVR